MAKHWLVQALSKETYSENLKSEVERLQWTTKQSKDTLTQLENKLLTAKEMRKKFMLRQEAAKLTMQMNAALKELFSSSALERMEEETFLAEAKAELMQPRPK
ncbi:PspA/IM30 family protein [Paenibacillus sp. MMO-177]|uniref:PspA/IM30 family protein n=1 Tax=Paenibacillus sp. MMO-177 TaxID=3081289 RepID=UPI003019908A